jgi:hypothetical protein
MGLLLAAAIMGGGQMIGAQLSRDAAKRERDNHFVNLRESARRGGFNPLTVLRATGGGGYGQYVPLLSRSPLGEGISAGTSFYANMQRDMYFTKQNQAHEMRMTRENNAAAMQRDNMARRFSKMERLTQAQTKAMEVPLIGTDGKPIIDNEGNPMFMHALNQEVQPMWIAVRNPVTNKVFAYPNPELADMGPAEFATFMGLTSMFEKHADDGTDFTFNGMGLPGQTRFGRGIKVIGDNGTFSYPDTPLTRSMGWPQGVAN